jgi:CBS domain-containing protein
MSVAEIIHTKGAKVISIKPEQTILEAIRLLVSQGVGSLLVVDENQQIRGMITERDILRENARRFDQLSGTKVSQVMTEDVLIGLMDDSLDYVMNLMTEKRIRHLPIMDQGKLVGIISIGDLVKAKMRQAEVEIRHLTDYITGQYPA